MKIKQRRIEKQMSSVGSQLSAIEEAAVAKMHEISITQEKIRRPFIDVMLMMRTTDGLLSDEDPVSAFTPMRPKCPPMDVTSSITAATEVSKKPDDFIDRAMYCSRENKICVDGVERNKSKLISEEFQTTIHAKDDRHKGAICSSQMTQDSIEDSCLLAQKNELSGVDHSEFLLKYTSLTMKRPLQVASPR